MNKQLIIPCFMLTVIGYACNGSGAQPEKQVAVSSPHYQLATVEKTSVDQLVKLPAQLAAFEEVSIFPKVNGYVETVRGGYWFNP